MEFKTVIICGTVLLLAAFAGIMISEHNEKELKVAAMNNGYVQCLESIDLRHYVLFKKECK